MKAAIRRMGTAMSPPPYQVAAGVVVVAAALFVGAARIPAAQSRSVQSAEPVSYVRPTWSPDNRRLAFLEWRPRGPVSVVVANADGTERRDVAMAAGIGEVTWAPRGNLLAYSWARAFEQPPYFLAVVQIAGSPRTLTPGLDIDWAPDGRRLAFVRGLAGGPIETISVGGRRPQRLTPREYSSDAEWAPDGGVIAFTRRRRPGGAEQVFTVRSDGRSMRPVTRRHSCCATWSPDGRRLVFIGRLRRNVDRTALYVIRRDGTGERRISPSYGPLRSFWFARWSPTGSRILFMRVTAAGSPYSLGLAGPDGRIRYLGRGESAQWSPNGRAIAFSADCADGSSTVFVMDADGSNRRAVVPCAP
jgi:TolB protein